ncbi:MAG: hypothetical protein WDN48_18705 [Pseudolabrys sp.]
MPISCKARIGRPPSEGELYMAHFLGADGAGKLINVAANQPRVNAADMFPQAAAANPSIFYDSAGHGRSASEVYAKLSGRFDVARAGSFAPDCHRQAPRSRVAVPFDTAGVTQAYATANESLPALPDSRPLFQAMFTDRARAAVTADRQQPVGTGQKTRARTKPRRKRSRISRPGRSTCSPIRRPIRASCSATHPERSIVVNTSAISMVNALLSLVE